MSTHTHSHTQEASAIAVPISQSWKVRCRGVHHLPKVTNKQSGEKPRQSSPLRQTWSPNCSLPPRPFHGRDSLYLKGDAWEPIYPKCFPGVISFLNPPQKSWGKLLLLVKKKKKRRKEKLNFCMYCAPDQDAQPPRGGTLLEKGQLTSLAAASALNLSFPVYKRYLAQNQ